MGKTFQAEKKVKKKGMEDRIAMRVWGRGAEVFSADHLESRSIEY